jgi:hypothetical protein
VKFKIVNSSRFVIVHGDMPAAESDVSQWLRLERDLTAWDMPATGSYFGRAVAATSATRWRRHRDKSGAL